MKYNRIHINQFGALQNRTLDFNDGINVIYSPSADDGLTIRAFLQAMQFGLDPIPGSKDTDHLYDRFYPGEGKSTYGGVLEFTQQDHVFSMFRNFRRDPRGMTLMDETLGSHRPLSEEAYQDLIHHMTLPLYRDTIAVPPIAADAVPTAEAVETYINNLKSTGSAAIDIAQVKARLEAEVQRKEAELSPGSEQQYLDLKQQTKNLEEKLAVLPDASDLPEISRKKVLLRDDMAQTKARLSEVRLQYRTHETILKEHSRYAEGTLKEAEDRCQRLISRREKLLKRYPEPSSSLLSRLSPLLTVLLALLFLASLIFGLTQLAGGNIGSAVPSFLIAAVSLFLLPRMIQRWRAQMAFRYVDRSLKHLYHEIWTDAPEYVTPENLKDFMDTMTSLRNHRRQLSQCRKLMETLNQQLTDQKNQLDSIQKILDAKRENLADKQTLQNEICRCEADMEALIPTLKRNQEIQEELQSLNESLQTISELAADAFLAFRQFMEKNASQIINEISSGRCHSLKFCENNSVTLQVNGQELPLSQLDGGTLDQICLAIRIACIRFFWPEDHIPIFLEDAFCHSDRARQREAYLWLTSAYTGQVFLFTLTERETDVLKALGISFTDIAI